MIKLFILTSLVAITTMVSCKKSNINDPVTIETPKIITDAIDSETPKGVQPYILSNETVGTAVSTNAAPNGYTLVWSDEFNSGSLNSSKWNKTESSKSRTARADKGISNWFFKTDQITFNATKLILKATKFNSNTMYCGSVDSKSKFEPKYGYLEVLVDNADISRAVHTAFWLQGPNQGNIDGSGNDGCEVDVFESAFTDGKRTQSALHWDGYGASAQGWTKHWNNAGNFGGDIHSGYHVIGLEWDANSLAFYYDGVKMFTYTGVGVPRVNEFLWLSTGASFGDGDFASRAVGYLTEARIDWVRIYAKN